jgi:hypothetical protein
MKQDFRKSSIRKRLSGPSRRYAQVMDSHIHFVIDALKPYAQELGIKGTAR